MTRKEYLEILTRRLAGIDEASLKDIIMELEDHIDGLERESPEKSPEQIIETLESPELFADSLREAAGLGPYSGSEHGESETEEAGAAHEKPSGDRPGSSARKTVRITIDDEELDEAIRKAFDIARIFSRRRKDKEEESLNDIFASAFELKDVELAALHKISLRVRSADVQVLFSNDHFSIETPGEDKPHLRMEYASGGALKISTPMTVSEPDRIDMRVPASVDELEVSTLSGDVRVLDRVGSLSVTTASGDVRVETCDGDLQIKSASGDIVLSQCREDIKASTASGDISIHADDMCNSLEAASASGDIELAYPEGWDAMVSVSTVSGEIDHDGSASGKSAIRIGSGLVPVRISTVSGDIRIAHE